jgi:hypothetical protein
MAKLTQDPIVKKPVITGAPAQKVSTAGADQLGQAMGSKRRDRVMTNQNSASALYSGAMKGVGATKLGNELVNNVGKGGPGAGREIIGKSGTQQMYGKPAPGNPPAHRPILSEYGPDYKGNKR